MMHYAMKGIIIWKPQFSSSVKLYLCIANDALRHEGIWRSGCIDPRFLDLSTRWSWGPRCFTVVPIGLVWWALEPAWATWRREKFWHYQNSNSWHLGCPALSQSICRLFASSLPARCFPFISGSSLYSFSFLYLSTHGPSTASLMSACGPLNYAVECR
jgi:hypothetical protein